MGKPLSSLRMLVAICSFGEKHLPLLRRIIAGYQRMEIAVDVVVFSEGAKVLGDTVEVRVGLPSSDPWSLGFAHKKIFAERVSQYDLFLYSEDDVEITSENIQAFLDATEYLADDEVAGFLLHERDPGGEAWINGFYSFYHWDPASVRRRKGREVAEFTNAHSACYLLTQEQLRRAIASGGFLRRPSEGVYDLLCTAATDPYVNCGLRKVICISEIERFLVRHLPDLYFESSPVSLTLLKQQIATLRAILNNEHPGSTLLRIRPKFWHGWFQKSYYERPSDELLSQFPSTASRIVSVGAGDGALERTLGAAGHHVTALPLDSVAGAALGQAAIDVVYGSWEEARERIGRKQFDVLVATNLLHLVPEPEAFVAECAALVSPGGLMIFTGPNLNRLPWRLKRKLRLGPFGTLRDFTSSGISVVDPHSLFRCLGALGFGGFAVHWLNHEIGAGRFKGRVVKLGRWTAREWTLATRKDAGAQR